jgi:hypothetical protein
MSPAEGRELAVRAIAVHGFIPQGASTQVEWVLEATVDGVARRSEAASTTVSVGSGAGISQQPLLAWADATHGSLIWRMSEAGVRRLQAHEPRLRLDLLASAKDGVRQLAGFISIDIRDIRVNSKAAYPGRPLGWCRTRSGSKLT